MSVFILHVQFTLIHGPNIPGSYKMANIIILISQMRKQKAFLVVQSLSRVRLFATPWTAAHQAPLSSAITRSLHKFTSIESVIMSNHLTLCRPLLLLRSTFSSSWVFYNQSAFCIRWSKCWSFIFSISPSNEHSERLYY